MSKIWQKADVKTKDGQTANKVLDEQNVTVKS
jgi:hypothetical protein